MLRYLRRVPYSFFLYPHYVGVGELQLYSLYFFSGHNAPCRREVFIDIEIGGNLVRFACWTDIGNPSDFKRGDILVAVTVGNRWGNAQGGAGGL